GGEGQARLEQGRGGELAVGVFVREGGEGGCGLVLLALLLVAPAETVAGGEQRLVVGLVVGDDRLEELRGLGVVALGVEQLGQLGAGGGGELAGRVFFDQAAVGGDGGL